MFVPATALVGFGVIVLLTDAAGAQWARGEGLCECRMVRRRGGSRGRIDPSLRGRTVSALGSEAKTDYAAR
jgi:hypothetical protein